MSKTTPVRLRSVQCIWDGGAHNAFPELVRYQNRWLCAFREAEAHMSNDGFIRLLSSHDGLQWNEATTLRHPDGDLREVRASVAPDGRLHLYGGVRQENGTHFQSLMWVSADGETWSDAIPIGSPNQWLWRVRWHQNTAYGIAYTLYPRAGAHLLQSQDGMHWEQWVENVVGDHLPSESDLHFWPDQQAVCVLRRDGKTNTSLIGRANPPYRQWTFSDCGTAFHCPALLRLPNGTLLAGGRLLEPSRTALCTVDLETNTLHEILTLPSGGDSAYPAMVLHEETLWVCYYSSHEGQTNIYLAQVEID